MIQFAQGSLILWPVVVLFIFERQSIRRAIVTSFVAAWLFLPPIALPLSGIPDWSKTTATTFGVLAALLIKQPQRFLNFRPRWFDLPVIGFCFCPMVSSLAMGVGVYEGSSAILDEVVRWGLPYLIGRIYLGDAVGARQLALGIAIGGLLYVPLCLAEIRLSPVLKFYVYGMTNLNNAEFGMRYGGYRPSVFLTSGLEVGWWMCCAWFCAYHLLASQATRRFFNFPAIPVVWILAIVAVACKATGALVQIGAGVVLIQASRLVKTALPLWLLLMVAPVYCITRSSGYASGEQIGSIASQFFAADRIQSLEFRFHMEDYFINMAAQHPFLGWTRVGGFNPTDENGKNAAVTDGFWIITYCCTGAVGLSLLNLMLLVPTGLFLREFPVRTWRTPLVAPLLAQAIILPLFMIDNLSNAMLNPIYAISMGVVASCSDRRLRHQWTEPTPGDEAEDQEAEQELEALTRQTRLVQHRPARRNVEELARLHSLHARGLTERGQPARARTDRWAAEDLWRSITATSSTPGETWTPERSANANDLAWLMAHDPQVDGADLTQARRLVEDALEFDPTKAAHWNTLGLVCYRQADYHRGIQALSRSVTLDRDGGTAFDFYFLALANRALGYHQAAATWLDRAESWRSTHPEMGPVLASIRAEAITARQ